MDNALTREELYELVWASPMQHVAPQFGISSVWLAKICRKANIPVPGRGYWAKTQAGQPAQVDPLPVRSPGEASHTTLRWPTAETADLQDEAAYPFPTSCTTNDVVDSPPVFPDDLGELTETIRKVVGTIRVRPLSHQTHPAIAALIEKDERRTLRDSRVYGWTESSFAGRTPQRRLRLLNALFLALEHRGAKPAFLDEQGRDGRVLVGGTPVGFSIFSPRSHRGLTPVEAASMLSFSISGANERPARRTWNEKERRLDEQLADIVVAVLVTAEELRREGERSRYDAMVRLREEQAAAERARMAREEELARRKLEDDAASYHRAAEVRSFVEAVRSAAAADDLSVEAWTAWALAHAASIDPVLSRSFLRKPTIDRFGRLGLDS